MSSFERSRTMSNQRKASGDEADVVIPFPNEESPHNESASIPRSPTIPETRWPESGDDDDAEEIIKKRKLKRGRRNFRAKNMLQWGLNFSILGCLVASMTVEKLEHKMVCGLQLWKWCVFGMALFWGKLLVYWTIQFIAYLFGRNFMLRKKALYFVVGLKNSIQAITWMLFVLIVWKYLLAHGTKHKLSRKDSRILKIVTRTIISTLVGSFLFLLKRLWLLVLAYNFHINAFFDKMQDALLHQYILQTLSGPSQVKEAEEIALTRARVIESRIRRSKMAQKRRIDFLQNMKNRENVSSWTMKVLADEIRSKPLSVSSNLDWSFDEADKVIDNEVEAIGAAYWIFRNVAEPGCRYITEGDLFRFMIKEEACLVFPMIDRDASGEIDRKSLTEWVIRAYKSRKILSRSIADIEGIIEQLDRIVTWILIVVVIILWIILLELIKLDVIVLLLSAAAFMLGNPCKSIFDAIIFVFVVHPFDVGDRCVVDDIELLVEDINILTTVFLKTNNEKVLYPNSVLSAKPISNYYRSPDMVDAVEFSIDYATPKDKIGLLNLKIKSYLERSPQHWHPQHSLVVKDVENSNRINMILHCHHNINFQEFGEKNKRRAELLDEIMKLFEEFGIKFFNIRCSDKFVAGLPSES